MGAWIPTVNLGVNFSVNFGADQIDSNDNNHTLRLAWQVREDEDGYKTRRPIAHFLRFESKPLVRR